MGKNYIKCYIIFKERNIRVLCNECEEKVSKELGIEEEMLRKKRTQKMRRMNSPTRRRIFQAIAAWPDPKL